jgi:uncharacterized protein
MKRGLRLSMLFILFHVSGIFVSHAQTGNRVVIGTIDSMYSRVLGEYRKIWVYVPTMINGGIYAPHRYPVVYLLDGDGHFSSVVGMIQQLSQVNGNTVTPEMMVVGILNTDRTRDLTPTHVQDGASESTSGGGEKFTSFLEQELIPRIDSLYLTSPYRVLVGHSFGGLLAVNILIHHANLFSSYVAIDPSLWWDHQKLLNEATALLPKARFENKSLFLAIANTMRQNQDTMQVRRDTNSATEHIRSILSFGDALKRNPENSLRWMVKYYDDDIHASVPLIAEYDALHFFFSELKIPKSLLARLSDSTFNAESAIVAHFKKASMQMGYEIIPPEAQINAFGYTLLGNKLFSRARPFFELNIKNYPNSLNVYDSMGDYYVAVGDKQKAIECFTKAYSVNRWEATKKKLEDLKAAK